MSFGGDEPYDIGARACPRRKVFAFAGCGVFGLAKARAVQMLRTRVDLRRSILDVRDCVVDGLSCYLRSV